MRVMTGAEVELNEEIIRNLAVECKKLQPDFAHAGLAMEFIRLGVDTIERAKESEPNDADLVIMIRCFLFAVGSIVGALDGSRPMHQWIEDSNNRVTRRGAEILEIDGGGLPKGEER